jgi:ATP-dependent Zn protease
MNLENELDRTAIHEAGHAVVCWDLGYKVNKVSIIPDGQKGNVGSVTINDLEPIDYSIKSEENLKLIAERIIITLSGYIALKKAMGNLIGEGSSSDWVEAFCMADNFFSDAETNGKFIKDCISQVEKIFNSRWPYVEIVANELLKKETLIEQEFLQIIAESQGRCL